MAINKVQTGLRINESIYEKAKVLASRECRSLNGFMEYAIQQYIDEYEAKNGPIQVPEDE